MSLSVMYNGQCAKPARPLLIRGMPVDLFEAISSIYVMRHLSASTQPPSCISRSVALQRNARIAALRWIF